MTYLPGVAQMERKTEFSSNRIFELDGLFLLLWSFPRGGCSGGCSGSNCLSCSSIGSFCRSGRSLRSSFGSSFFCGLLRFDGFLSCFLLRFCLYSLCFCLCFGSGSSSCFCCGFISNLFVCCSSFFSRKLVSSCLRDGSLSSGLLCFSLRPLLYDKFLKAGDCLIRCIWNRLSGWSRLFYLRRR